METRFFFDPEAMKVYDRRVARPLTEAENDRFKLACKIAGTDFNPSGDPDVTWVKQQFAALFYDLLAIKAAIPQERSEEAMVRQSWATAALVNLGESQMQAVKLLTWRL